MIVLLFLLWAVPAATTAQSNARIQEGAAALEHNDLAKAQAAFEQATRLAPKDASAWLLLAQTYAKQKSQRPAVLAAQKAEALGASDLRILQGLANFYSTLAPDLPKAAELGARYAEKAPEDKTAWRRLAAFCLESGLTDRAIAAGTRGLSVDDGAELHAILGSAYARRGDWSNATAQMSKALKLNPYNEDAHFQLAQLFLRQQDFPSAVRVLENAGKIFDKSAQIELALGVAYYGERKFAEAVDRFLRTIQLAPDVPQPYIFLGRILDHANERLPEVTTRFVEFEGRNPDSYLGYLLHAKAIVAQLPATGFPAEAQTAFDLVQKSLAKKEDEAESHYLAGMLLDRKREFPQAASQLERSIQLNGKDSAAHYRLARVYDRLGRKEEAEQQRALHEKLSEEEKAPPPRTVARPAK
jgi:tetratricopeptide (TPR) repeat protein